ncbi:MAG: hypothetical protein HOC23_02455, partial [Halieaceae bacterium]|nr:hypothetical protein [Halieaceae bacterium]
MNQTHDDASVHHTRGDPLECYGEWSAQAQGASLLLVDFTLEQYWLPGAPSIELTALYCRDGKRTGVSVTDRQLNKLDMTPVSLYYHWAGEHAFTVVFLGDPLPLCPQQVAKPWGQEIWYTGVESRAVCGLGDASGMSPIPWVQAVMPGQAVGQPGQPLV